MWMLITYEYDGSFPERTRADFFSDFVSAASVGTNWTDADPDRRDYRIFPVEPGYSCQITPWLAPFD